MIYTVPPVGKFPCPELLLHPNIPKPLHGLNPREILGKVWWDLVRQAAYREHGFHCHACGVNKYDAKYHKWLEAHECYEINYRTGEVRYVRTVGLCHSCHNYIHSGRMEMILGTPEMSREKYNDIIEHGNQLLRSLKDALAENVALHDEILTNYDHYGQLRWEDWHLVIGGVRYERKHKTFKDWARFYDGMTDNDKD